MEEAPEVLGLTPAEWTAVTLSLRVALWAVALSLPFGVMLGWLLAAMGLLRKS